MPAPRNPNINRALNRFEKAVRADAWKGNQHPADIPYIEREFDLARSNLLEHIGKVSR